MKPYDVFWASVLYFICIVLILTTLLNDSAGIGSDMIMTGLILLTCGYYAFLAWEHSRRKKTKQGSGRFHRRLATTRKERNYDVETFRGFHNDYPISAYYLRDDIFCQRRCKFAPCWNGGVFNLLNRSTTLALSEAYPSASCRTNA